MRVLERREHPGLAFLYLAAFDGENRSAEFVDTLEPGVPKSEKWVMMISTQAGCPVGCRMCDAGALGYFGNLSAEEILAQVRHVVAANPELDIKTHPKVKIHFARMGEPSLNPGVLRALRNLRREYPFPGILPSLSTVAPKSPAVAPFFEELVEIKDRLFPNGRFQLQFSVHSTDAESRRSIVPIKTWSLEEIAGFGGRFVKPGDRKVTLNFALAPGETVQAEEIGRWFGPERFLIKITPVNPTHTADRNGATHVWSQPSGPIRSCAGRLEALGFEVILSPSLPEEIAAATSCGQLWSESLKDRAAAMIRNREREESCYVTPGAIAGKSRMWQRELARYRRHDWDPRPERSGLLVVDMQDFFLDFKSPAYRPEARAILGNVRRLAEAFRLSGRPVFFTRHAHGDPQQDGGPMASWWKKLCIEGTPWSRVSTVLDPREDETFRKYRYSAFSNPALEKAMRAAGVEDLAIAGIMTNLCVESTARDAFDKGFRIWTVLDGTAAHAEELHLGSLKSLAFGFSCLAATEELIARLSPCAARV